MQNALDILKRGIADLISEEELEKKLRASATTRKPLRIKYGADPSAPDIHLGHTVGLRKLRQFQDMGHTVVFIIGDFTATIGDPSGQSKTRPILTHEKVLENAKTYQEQVFKILDKDKTEVHFNSEWFGKMMFSDVIKLASQYSVARMLERDDFAIRYREKKTISILEFLYPLVQGYDSVMVKSDVELGGTDQTFNLLVGRDLQRIWNQEPQVVMTLPLLEGLDGKMKMSKSLGNAIGVNDSPKEMFGKIMSIPDALMVRYLELLTDVEEEKISKFKKEMEERHLNPMEIKKELGRKIVTQFHGLKEAQHSQEEFERVFSKKELPTEIEVFFVSSQRKGKDVWLVKLLQEAGLADSGSDARRAIQQGSVAINGEKVTDENRHVVLEKDLILKVGKRKIKKVEFSSLPA
ncbi:MAG: tyrosine--tRNA ligase [Chlamydiae bacterium]|nr:tyrosine--tRNA ligase [Chlamydiota bacterium]MBI3265971.1 tyrosine--tRNA ligase [Chlamydiota bacterium]